MSIDKVANKSAYSHTSTKPMKAISTLPILLLVLTFPMTGCIPGSEKNPAHFKLGVSRIPVRDVPKNVLQAAEHHIPGIYIHEASINHHRTHDVYELRGLSHQAHYDVYVTAEGHVLDIDHDKWLSD